MEAAEQTPETQSPKPEPRQPDAANAVLTPIDLKVHWRCAACGAEKAVKPTDQMLAMFLQGGGALTACNGEGCTATLALSLARQEPLIKPATPAIPPLLQSKNREARRTVASLVRRGLIVPG